MADTLSRIFGPTNIGNGTNTIFTGTGGHTYTLKTILIENNTAGGIDIKVGIGGVTDALLVLRKVTLGAGESIEFNGVMVLTGAETFQTNASATGLTITASGVDQS